MAQLLSHVEILRTLPPQASGRHRKSNRRWCRCIVTIVWEIVPGNLVDRSGVFAARRKTLRRALIRRESRIPMRAEKLSIDPRLRPENLSPEKILELFAETNRRSPVEG